MRGHFATATRSIFYQTICGNLPIIPPPPHRQSARTTNHNLSRGPLIFSVVVPPGASATVRGTKLPPSPSFWHYKFPAHFLPPPPFLKNPPPRPDEDPPLGLKNPFFFTPPPSPTAPPYLPLPPTILYPDRAFPSAQTMKLPLLSTCFVYTCDGFAPVFALAEKAFLGRLLKSRQ